MSFEDYVRKGAKTADGRDIFMAIEHKGRVYICCDHSILKRGAENLSIPDPGEVADDGYITPWEDAGPAPDRT